MSFPNDLRKSQSKGRVKVVRREAVETYNELIQIRRDIISAQRKVDIALDRLRKTMVN